LGRGNVGEVMNTDYFQEMEQALETVRTATGQSWEWEHTGGGHSAFILNLENGYYLITDGEALSPMPDELDDISLGWYADSDEWGEGEMIQSVTNLETLTTWAKELGGK